MYVYIYMYMYIDRYRYVCECLTSSLITSAGNLGAMVILSPRRSTTPSSNTRLSLATRT